MQKPETIGQQTYQGQQMKIIYSKDETLDMVKKHIADMLDVEITEISVSQYSTDFLQITCTQVGKQYAVDESYQDPA
jgi:ribosomal protein S24E